MKFALNKNKELLLRTILLLVGDIIGVFVAIYLSLLLRFSSTQGIIEIYGERLILFGIIFSILIVVAYLFMGLYRSLWTYASAEEMVKLFISSLAAVVLLFIINLIIPGKHRLPNGIFAVAFLIQTALSAIYRFSYRMLRVLKGLIMHRVLPKDKESKIVVIGSGYEAIAVIKGYKEGMHDGVVMAVIDREHQKGTMINGVMIRGDLDDLEDIINRYKIDDVIIASETFDAEDMTLALDVCSQTGARLRKYSDMSEVDGINRIVDIDPKDLLGRAPVTLDTDELSNLLKDSNVLVTGGGGSIGSELVKQMAAYKPARIIIVDIYENNAYLTKLAVQRKYPDLDVEVEIASVRDEIRMESIFIKYHPEIVFHAAAHKHVPLMEIAPCEAIKNNVMGTYNTAQLSDKYNVKRFVFISTDKAVNPTSVMGATKRIAEIIITSFNEISKTEFSAVRFGNVLGSSGSVIPIFKEQIQEGGPVLVTHPQIKRFFMTIPEACQLVLQAGAISKGGEIFVLDMQKPILISKLAEKMIKMYGYKPGKEIKIKYTDLRPGEKLYEEILINENAFRTHHDKIYIETNNHIPMSELKLKLDKLFECVSTIECKYEDLYRHIIELVPEYKRTTNEQ